MSLITFENISDFLKKYNAGEFNSSDQKIMIGAGWVDWWSHESQLKGKLDTFIPVIEAVAQNPIFDPQNITLRFKEVAPGTGGFIDGLRFQITGTGEGIAWCQVDENGSAEVWDFTSSTSCDNALPEKDRYGVESIARFFQNLK